jgi:integrase
MLAHAPTTVIVSKRGNGEGTIYQRRDGRWTSSAFIGGHRRYFYGRTRQDVARKLSAALHHANESTYVHASRASVTVAQVLDEWLLATKASIGPSTWIRYEQYARLHIRPFVGHVALKRLTPRDVQSLYGEALQRRLSPTTVNHLHTVFHTALQYAVKMEYVSRNVVAVCTPPRKVEQEVRTLSVEEARRMLAAASGDRLEALFHLALFTGMRQGELLALRWVNVDLDRCTVQVQGSLRRIHGELRFGQPKTKRSRRKVALAAPAVEALRRHRAAQAAERLAGGQAWQDLGLVFSDSTGGPLDAHQVVKRHFRPLLHRAELPCIKFHNLRHSAATLLLGLGTHPSVVQQMLGHAAVSITLDIYSHAAPILQHDAARALGDLVADTSDATALA